jgi:pimeloyl-ACP methyl ester carboxylesterase
MSAQSHPSAVESYLVRVEAGDVLLEGQLMMPAEPRGIIVFAHGSGSSRHSPRNKFVAQGLREDVGVGTLLIDLLSSDEDAYDAQTGKLRFDIELLARRLGDICAWLTVGTRTAALPIGLFGASTGAAAALIASTQREEVVAIVSRGGRPDLAGDAVLARVRAPTLLIVGGDDPQAIDLNRRAAQVMRTVHELTVIPGAGHLFAEPGKLGEVSQRAAAWFDRYLPARGDSDEPRG